MKSHDVVVPMGDGQPPATVRFVEAENSLLELSGYIEFAGERRHVTISGIGLAFPEHRASMIVHAAARMVRDMAAKKKAAGK